VVLHTELQRDSARSYENKRKNVWVRDAAPRNIIALTGKLRRVSVGFV